MSYWKKKITAFSLAGKGSVIYKSGRQSPKIGYVGPEIVLYPPAWNYDNLVGNIWMPEPQGYDVRSEGSIMIELREPSGTSPAGDINGGYYDNR